MDFYKMHLMHQQRLKFELGHINVVETFVPNPRAISIPEKFYSKWRVVKLTPEQKQDCEAYKEVVTHTIFAGPHQKYAETVLESHDYGWLDQELFTRRHDMQDHRRFFHGRVKSKLS